MRLSIPDALQAFIDEQVAAGRYESASAYVAHLIRADQERQAAVLLLPRVNAGEPLPGEAPFAACVEVLLQEAEASGEPIEVTAAEWQRIEQEAMAILRARTSA